jgi:hypothetical protein
MRIRQSNRVSACLQVAALVAAGPASAATLERLDVSASFETAGILATVAGADGDERLELEVRQGEGELRPAHPFVRVDPEHFASALFGLRAGTRFEIRVTLLEAGTMTGQRTATLEARPEPALPAPRRVVHVAPDGDDSDGRSAGTAFRSLQRAVDGALPGDEIRVDAGRYEEAGVVAVSGTPGAPIVVRGVGASRPHLAGHDGLEAGFRIEGHSDWVLDNLEISGYPGDDGKGIYLLASRRVTVERCFVHDNGYWNLLVSRGGFDAGEHLIQDNVIGDDAHAPDAGETSYDWPRDRPYYGIKLDNDPGPGTVIRRNRVYGVVDGVSFCGDEGRAPEDPGALLGAWSNRNLELYDNDVRDVLDDDLESDGLCINARVFRNRLGAAQNAISVAPAFPGPYFFVGNLAQGFRESSVKFNTRVPGVIRGLRFYHNTFQRTSPGAALTLWDGVPSTDVVFRNNVFAAPDQLIDMQPENTHRPDLDWDLWWSPAGGDRFVWENQRYGEFASWASASEREAHGLFDDPALDAGGRPAAGSPAIDSGVALPGINDDALGAPDLGAFEVGTRSGPGAGGAGGAGAAGGAGGVAGGNGGGSGTFGGGPGHGAGSAAPTDLPGGAPGGADNGDALDERRITGTCALAHTSAAAGRWPALALCVLALRLRRRVAS